MKGDIIIVFIRTSLFIIHYVPFAVLHFWIPFSNDYSKTTFSDPFECFIRIEMLIVYFLRHKVTINVDGQVLEEVDHFILAYCCV